MLNGRPRVQFNLDNLLRSMRSIHCWDVEKVVKCHDQPLMTPRIEFDLALRGRQSAFVRAEPKRPNLARTRYSQVLSRSRVRALLHNPVSDV